MSERARIEAREPAGRSFSELVREGCQGYVLHGIGLPWPAYIFHALKLLLLTLAWMFFCSFTPGVGSPWRVGEWWNEPIAFQKAFIFACMVEVLGFGCMSGPLGFHIWPPFTAFLHFLRPGTTKIAPFPNLPLFGGMTRSVFDVALYAAFVLALIRALIAPAIGTSELLPIVILLPLCGLADKTIILAARVEHHFAMIVCFLLSANWIAGCKAVQLSIWFWAGVSKLTVAFGYVIPVMTVNNPLVQSAEVRRRMFVAYPDDFTPSRLGRSMAHAGTFLELAAPLTLLFVSGPGPLLVLGMIFVLALHGFILGNMPAGAVFEWNLVSLYAAFFLFAGHPTVTIFDIDSVPLALYLIAGCLVLPLVGNFVPARVSFLVAMRYYAGNWAWNGWLFHGDSEKKLDLLKRASPMLRQQLERFAPAEAENMTTRGLAFRSLHLQGRALGVLLPKALGGRPFHEYSYVDGENVAGSVLGWNFGEGHLCDHRLLASIQAQCNFEEGELRVIEVESQPLFGSTLEWHLYDAKRGLLDGGYVSLADLAKRAPWDFGER
jgi:Transmembrane protein of unknown function (DUF3556)